MIFLIERKFVTYIEDDNPRVPDLEFGWARPEFEQSFQVEIPQEILSLNYETEANIYVINNNYNIESYIDPSEDSLLTWVSDKLSAIRHEAEYGQLKQSCDDGEDYNWDGSQWVFIPDPNQDQKIARRDLFRRRVELFQFIDAVWTVLINKGLVTNQDLPSDIRQIGVNWKNLLDKI